MNETKLSIFNSYVTVPEGNIHENDINDNNSDNNKKMVRILINMFIGIRMYNRNNNNILNQ